MKPIYLKLDKQREIKIGNRATIIFEEITGKKLQQCDTNNMGMKEMSALVFGGLFTVDRSLDFETVIDLIDEYGNVDEIGEKLGEAIDNSNFFKRANS